MNIEAETIARIDATLLPQLDRHHLRLLAHCLASFREMSPDSMELCRTLPCDGSGASNSLSWRMIPSF
jgi:hypothetical protein